MEAGARRVCLGEGETEVFLPATGRAGEALDDAVVGAGAAEARVLPRTFADGDAEDVLPELAPGFEDDTVVRVGVEDCLVPPAPPLRAEEETGGEDDLLAAGAPPLRFPGGGLATVLLSVLLPRGDFGSAG